MNIINKIDNYLIESKDPFINDFKKGLIKLSKMDKDSDERDDYAVELMSAIENKGYKINDEEPQPVKYNKRIKNIKKVVNLISDMVDDKNKIPYITKIMNIINDIIK